MNKKILLQITGSIAAYKTCQLISLLVKKNYEVQTVATSSALKFIGAATFEGLSGRPVLSDLWQEGQAMAHIDQVRQADLIIICPATANTINKLAAGIAEDLIGNMFLANNFQKPVWIVPAMNSEMYSHPATKESLEKLETWGCRVFETQSGRLACGEEGFGKMQEAEFLFAKIEEHFKKGKKK